MNTKTRATIITAERINNTPSTLPHSWKQALGVLRYKHIDPLHYQKTIRKEWTKRLHKQQRLAS